MTTCQAIGKALPAAALAVDEDAPAVTLTAFFADG
jgi:hypothetical protein